MDFLTALGVANLMVCNMAAAVPEILGLDVAEQLKPVTDYLAARGVSGKLMCCCFPPNAHALTMMPSGNVYSLPITWE